ncbi:MAG: glutamyl-tRNA reductase [Syntrophomonadaceae bacterium]|jgi:glutamyl-tRNA reductase
MYVLLTGLNHRSAPVEIREKFAFTESDLERVYTNLNNRPEIEGVVLLTTCNRTEIYVTARNQEDGLKVLKTFMEEYSGIDNISEYTYQPSCYNAISHLFRVAAGLDSMILGETQILGQVKEAYQKAMDYKASDGVLNALFQKALYVGKKVRTDTAIDQHPVSVSYAAVELASSVLGGLADKTVLVVGAGEMSELTTRYLMDHGVKSVIVSNRSYEKAVYMANCLNGRAVRFDALAYELAEADIVISCTAANHYVLKKENCAQVLQSRQGKKIIMIDIAVPRDIDPALRDITGVHIYDIDDLKNVVDANYKERYKASLEAEKIIAEEMVKFNEWLATLYVIPVVTALKATGERIKQNELKRAFNRLGKVSQREQEVISSMANSIVNQLLHYPVINLKNVAATNEGHLYAEVVKKLFDLQVESKEQEYYEKCEAGNKG